MGAGPRILKCVNVVLRAPQPPRLRSECYALAHCSRYPGARIGLTLDTRLAQ